MADVARLAGVSQQTVSRVVNGSPSIRPQTRTRVQEAIDRLGYRPNSAARALVKGRTGILGVINTASAHYGPNSIQRTIEDAAREAGLFASSVSLSRLTREILDDSVEHLLRQLVEGIIFVAGQDEALAVARSRSISVPIVVVEGDLTRAPWTVGIDQVAGARLATRHLLELGHREIVHLGGPVDFTEARARRDSWRSEMVAAGLRPMEPIMGDWSAAGGYARGQRLATNPEVTAVFAANDQIAIGLLRALHEAGRRVPRGRQRGRLRRPAGDGLSDPPADHGAAGLPGVGAAGHRADDGRARGLHHPGPGPDPARADHPGEYRASAALSRRIRGSAYAAQTMINTNSAR